MKLGGFGHGDALKLPTAPGAAEQVHFFDQREITAIRAAIAARRPLLLRGEPGIGKSQLAKAAALALERAFVGETVDGKTEARDLLWTFDAVARLATAQLASAPGFDEAWLEAANFLKPGPLWWGLDWSTASHRAERAKTEPPNSIGGGDWRNGVLVLIDEIDKADADVPNGLLEALGSGSFRPLGFDKPVFATNPPPLVIVTANEERALPDAFLRRCLVHELALPDKTETVLEAYLLPRAIAHFDDPKYDREVMKAAAKQLFRDRSKARTDGVRPLPGQAEYLDLNL